MAFIVDLWSEAEQATQLPSPPADAPVQVQGPSDCGPDETLNVEKASPTPPVRNHNFDPEFYFNGGFIVFEVEDHLFRAPTYMFAKESKHFVTEFKILEEDDFGTERIIVLPSDVERDDFRTLLKVLYPSSVSTTVSLTVPEWGSVLKLSTKWRFGNLREMAISHLTSLPSDSFQPPDKISFGRQYLVSAWFLDGLEQIVVKEETISDDDAIKMGHITAFRLSRLREMKLKEPPPNTYYYDYTNYIRQLVAEKIQLVFAVEIASIKAEEQLFKPSRKKKFGKRK